MESLHYRGRCNIEPYNRAGLIKTRRCETVSVYQDTAAAVVVAVRGAVTAVAVVIHVVVVAVAVSSVDVYRPGMDS